MSKKMVVIGALAVMAAGVFGSRPAEAGTYPVVACLADSAKRTHAFTAFATRGMRIRRACGSAVRSSRGLLAGNVVRRGSVPRNARAELTLRSPAGMRFATLNWTGSARRTDCNYEIEMAAVGPGVAERLTKIVAGKKCPKRGSAQAASRIRGDGPRNIRGADRIVLRTLCKAKRGRRCSTRRANYARFGIVSATVEDVEAPTVSITGGELVSGRWVRGSQPVTFVANDGAGVQSASVFIGGFNGGGKANSCDHSLPVPCPSGPDALNPNTGQARDGTHQTVVVATDAAGNVGFSAPVISRVDNTAPLQIPVTASGGEGWRASNSFGANWLNPPEGDAAPIDAALYRICRAGGACEDTQTSTSTGELSSVQVPAPGEWTLKMWRRDQAGNADENNASSPVTLRYDPEAPKLSIAPVDVSDPTLVSAPVADPLSGVASGQIEISKAGSNSWQTLATKLEGERLQARIDDAALPAGRYLLRASAVDRAGNIGVTDKRTDGTPAEVDLPLRLESKLSAGFVKNKTVRRVVRRKGKRRVVRRRVAVLRPKTRARLGRRAPITGRLVTGDGRALAGSQIYVFGSGPDGVERFVGTATTDAAGRYRYLVRASANQQLRLFYLGAPSVRPAIQAVQLEVPARTRFSVNDRRLLNGQSVKFRGRLAVAPTGIANGKLVELQTKLSGRWQTFRTVRTDAQGRWRSTYRFRRTRGLIRYRFRARLPREAAYPYGTGASKSIRVTVRGR